MPRSGTRTLVRDMLRRVGLEPIDTRKGQLVYTKDRAFHHLYETATAKTSTPPMDEPLRRDRHYTLTQLVSNAPLESGDVCELGCWRGLTAYQIAAHVRASGRAASFHIFDSFEGLSDPQADDEPSTLRAPSLTQRSRQICSLDVVQRNLREFSFIEYHPGWIPTRFADVQDRTFSFVHVDVVRYQPTRDSVMFFYPRLAAGGIMVFDDYGYTQFPGAQKAIDECRAHFGHPFFLSLPSGQAFLIKNVHGRSA